MHPNCPGIPTSSPAPWALEAGATSKITAPGTPTSSTEQRQQALTLPWKDCQSLVDFSPNWVFWHHWPDSKLHDGSGAGQGLDTLDARRGPTTEQ